MSEVKNNIATRPNKTNLSGDAAERHIRLDGEGAQDLQREVGKHHSGVGLEGHVVAHPEARVRVALKGGARDGERGDGGVVDVVKLGA